MTVCVAGMADDLERFRDRRPVRARRTGPLGRAVRAAKRNRARLTAAVVGGVLSTLAALAIVLDRLWVPDYVERLGPGEALRTLVAAVPVPLGKPLWSRALAVVVDTVSRVQVYRMAWTLGEPPWDRLAAALAEEP